MSRVFKVKCDNCEREVDDMYEQIGWIIIKGTYISCTCGRKHDGQADTNYVSIPHGELHFCSVKCLVDFLRIKKFGKTTD